MSALPSMEQVARKQANILNFGNAYQTAREKWSPPKPRARQLVNLRAGMNPDEASKASSVGIRMPELAQRNMPRSREGVEGGRPKPETR
jgi:hypothetical protein